MSSTEIVVGADGSPASQVALRWAVAHAARNQASVTAVEVGHHAQFAPGAQTAVQLYGMAPPLERVTHRTRLHDAVVAARGAMRDAPPITELHVDGQPGVELTRLAGTASMLVLGHVPRGRLAELILGSTATECLRHARCPVVLVPVDSWTS
jgi:nucleotide-binding universal stress UspA family protein